MNLRSLPLAALAAIAWPASAQHDHGQAPAARPAARPWTGYPLLLPAAGPGGGRGAATLRPVGIEAREVRLLAAAGPAERRNMAYPVGPAGARIEAAAPDVGNYHWAVARQEGPDTVRVATTAWYFSNPGPAPTALLEQTKGELEIVPRPLPREHSGYRESEKWRFLVRLDGVPLAGHPLVLETEFGSRLTFVTDGQGMATVLFPRDFRTPEGRPEGGRDAMGPRRAGFVLAAETESGGRRYLTAFNYSYSPDPDRSRSLAWGAAFGLLGMAAATPLLRRRAVTAPGGADHA